VGLGGCGDGVLEDLPGLRSFTIMGWVKPESLEMGSGGNRIVFCLNGDHSGIDLVSHTDGRLRLAVNQWPDSVRNDSATGKLQVGQVDLLRRYLRRHPIPRQCELVFQPAARCAGGDRSEARLARPPTMPARSATDIGPLVIGNFNHTMRSYGLDRQFRGEIRAVQLFGSRVGDRGALTLELIRKHLR
jgi:hypothetical protein